MSPPFAQPRPPRRRRKSSGVITSSLFALVLVVVCVYAVWGAGPLNRAWNQLGFGMPKSGQATAQINTPDTTKSDADWTGSSSPGSGSKTPSPPLPFSSLGSQEFDDDADANKFLPEKRLRQKGKIRRSVTETTANSDPELDRRFELEGLNSTDFQPNSVRTADHEEPSDAQRHRPKFPRHKTMQFEVDPIETDNLDDAASTVQQIGDETQFPQKTQGTSRSGTKAQPASAVPKATGSALDVKAIQGLIEEGREAEAYQLLAMAHTRNPSERPRYQELLDQVAQRIYFTPQPQIEPPYEIQPGDQLRKIASKYNLSWQYLSKVNQVDAKKIRPGKKLKVFQGPFNATVDLSDYELTIFLNGKYVKRYKVGVGKDNSSPVGEFTVKEKLENPTYYGPDGNVLAADDPQNPLGERWIDIGNSFGIHGTIDPDSIGKSDSAGCIRMRNADVAEVYDLLTVGSTVIIQR